MRFATSLRCCTPWNAKPTAIEKAYDATQQFARAKSEAHLRKRLPHSDTAHHACEQALALYDHLAILLHLLRAALQ